MRVISLSSWFFLAAFGGTGALAAQASFPPDPSDQAWLEATSRQYTIHYVDEYRQDIPFVRRCLNAADRLMREKYGINSHGYEVYVYLEPAPTGYAGVGRAVIFTWGSNDNEQRFATIHYMTPSAPAWEEARRQGSTTSIGRPFDDHYHAKTLMHEYVTVGHQAAKRSKESGWDDAPSWFVQGLEEYDGLFHTTPENRTDGFGMLLAHADQRLREEIHCCRSLGQPTFGTSDPYFGGTLILRFLAEAYGEDIHAAVLRSREPTFSAALKTELESRGTTIQEGFTAMQAWFNGLLD